MYIRNNIKIRYAVWFLLMWLISLVVLAICICSILYGIITYLIIRAREFDLPFRVWRGGRISCVRASENIGHNNEIMIRPDWLHSLKGLHMAPRSKRVLWAGDPEKDIPERTQKEHWCVSGHQDFVRAADPKPQINLACPYDI